MSTITFDEYKHAIRAKYVVKKTEDVSGILLNPTPAQLRNLCLLLFENNLSTNDESILRNFFGVKEEQSLRGAIANGEIGKFKPIISFLKGEKESDHVARIELAAVLVDFNPRPYSKYLQRESVQIVDRSEKFLVEEKEVVIGDTFSPADVIDERAVVDYKSKSRKRIGIGVVVLVFLFFMGYTGKGVFFPKKECMQWNNTYYEAVDCSNYEVVYGQENSVFPLEENTMKLKKLEVNNRLNFFKNDKPIVWYCKNQGVITLFNGPGFHPETGKPLKPITKYIIEKYNLQH